MAICCRTRLRFALTSMNQTTDWKTASLTTAKTGRPPSQTTSSFNPFMHTFTTNSGTYTITCELIPANDDRSAYWKIDVFHDSKRANDASYTITQQDAQDILACSGRNPVEELHRIAEADVVLGRNQICGPIPPHPSTKFMNFKGFLRGRSSRESAMREFIRLFFPSPHNPEDHQAQDHFNARRERFASLCAMEFGAGLLDFDSIEQKFGRLP